MTTRRAACSCGQLALTIEGEPVRVSMCHCYECQRRTGAVISNQARFRPREDHLRRQVHRLDAQGRERQRADVPLLSGVRLDRILGGPGLPRLRRRRHRHLRRPELPRADHRRVGGVPPPLGKLAARHPAEARGEARVMRELSWSGLARPSSHQRAPQLAERWILGTSPRMTLADAFPTRAEPPSRGDARCRYIPLPFAATLLPQDGAIEG